MELLPMKILVTGAKGMVGNALVNKKLILCSIWRA